MLNDVINALVNKDISGGKRPSKETLNHAELIEYVSGINPYVDTKNAYLKAYEKLGIDIVNRVPEENASSPLMQGQSLQYNQDYKKAYLGLYDTYCRSTYPFEDVDEILECEDFSLNYRKLITPVPHKLDLDTIKLKQKILGNKGLYYYMYYTTLFMWGVEWLGWEMFMLASTIDIKRFDEVFLEQAFAQSLKDVNLLSQTNSQFVFLHDDLADARGPVFRPDFYDNYIFPRYKKLFNIIKEQGKKIIFTADGNMEYFLPTLFEMGVDGVMLENPATDFDAIMKVFGDKIIIGGVNTSILTNGSISQVRSHVQELCEKTKYMPGFAISSCGGLHGNIPLENLLAYFDVRQKYGFN